VASFPDVDLERTFNVMFGADLTADPSTWVRTDLTSRVLPVPINIRRGVVVGAQNTVTTLATVTCTNDDGALTPLLATSPYYPYVDNGTPAELFVRSTADPYAADVFSRTVSNGWGATSTSGYTWTPGTASQYNVASGVGTITFTSKADTSKAIKLDLPIRNPDVVFDSSINAVQTGVGSVIGPSLREIAGSQYVHPFIEFTTAGTIRCGVFEFAPGSVSALQMALVTQPALTYTAGTVIRTRCQLSGGRIRVKAWLAAGTEPAGWTVDIPTKVFATGDLTGMRTYVFTTNTNTLPVTFTVDNIAITQAPVARLEGYIAGVRPTFIPIGGGNFSSTVQIDIAGIGSRSERKDATPIGALRRSIEKTNPPPIQYWPCEDAEDSTIAVSAFPGLDPMLVTGPAVFSFPPTRPSVGFQSRFGSKPLVSLAAGAKLSGTVPPTTVQNEWAVSVVAKYYVSLIIPAVTEMRILEWQTPSSPDFNRWALVGLAAGTQVRAYNDAAGTVTNVATSASFFTGQLDYTVQAAQNGANIDVTLLFNDNFAASGSVAGTMAQPTRVIANPDRANVTASVDVDAIKFVVGHIRVNNETSIDDLPVYTDAEQGGVTVDAGSAWYHESAHKRLARLCAEERVPFVLRGNPAVTGLTVLNAQQDGTFTTLTATAAESESGALLFEAEFGYAMLPRTARYAQSAALTLDMSTYAYGAGTNPADILVPSLDPRGPNVISVQRANGAERTYAADPAFRQRRGSIAQGYTLDVLTDDDPLQHAAWRVHQNVDGRDANYPSLTVDLAANPALVEAWLGCDMGSRIRRTNQPTIAGGSVVDQVLVGLTELIGPKTWQVTLDAVPAKVWDVGAYDAATTLYSPSSSTLTGSALTTTGLSFSVDSGGEAWVTGAVSLVIQIDNEWIAVSNIAGTGPYTFTVPVGGRAQNGVVASHLVGSVISLANPARYAL
jgi:hypothetical protein